MSVTSTKTFLNTYTRLNNRRKHIQELADTLTSQLHARLPPVQRPRPRRDAG